MLCVCDYKMILLLRYDFLLIGALLLWLRLKCGFQMQVAAGEQAKITKLRIFKLLESYSRGECSAKL